MFNLHSLSYLLFFFSGFAALVYEVVWARQFSALLGSTVESVSVVLAVFLGGMALGGMVLGRLADSVRNPFIFFAVLEALIGVFGLTAPAGFGVMENLYYSGGLPTTGLAAAMVAVYLIFPTFLIGGTLPALSRFCLAGDRNRSGLAAGGLYATNTLGAAAGTLMAGFIFLEQFGVSGSLRLAAMVNLTVAAAVFLLLAIHRGGVEGTERSPAAPDERRPAPERSEPTLTARGMILAACFLAGCSTLAHEVIWTRILSQFFKNSVYSFSTMLFAVLLGLAAGGGAGSWLTHRLKERRFALAAVQLAAGLCSLAGIFLLLPYTELTNYLELFTQFGGYRSFGRLAAFEVAAALCLVFPPALLMGTAFPLMAGLAWRPAARFGGFMGDLQFVVTAGNAAGALIMALVLIPFDGGRFGLLNCILCAAGANVLAALLLLGSLIKGMGKVQWAAAAALLACSGALVAALPADLRFWKSSSKGEELVFYMSDKVAEVAVVGRSDGMVLKVNNTSGLGGTAGEFLETRLGIMAMLLRGGSERALVMGLGTGNTMQGLLAAGARNVDCVEIIAGVAVAAQHFHAFVPETPAGGQLRIFPGVDARVFLRWTDRTYDLILGDLYFPWQAETGFMYTVEHFRRVKNRLSEDGIFVQWLPLYQLGWEEFGIIGYTFSEVFEHVAVFLAAPNVAFPVVGLVGSRKLLPLDPIALQDRLDRHLQKPMIQRFELDDAVALLALYLGDGWRFRSQAFQETQVNTEDRTLVEFRSARIYEDSDLLAFTNFRNLADDRFREDAAPVLHLPEVEAKRKLELEMAVRNSARSMAHFLEGHTLFLREAYLTRLALEDKPEDLKRLREEMGKACLMALQAAPQYPPAQELFGRVWGLFIREKNFTAANNLAAFAVEADPDRDDFYNKLGLGLLLEERYREAVVCLTGAVTKNGENHSARANLAIALFLQGDRVRAREEMDRVVRAAGYRRLSDLTAALAVLILEGVEPAMPALEPFLVEGPWRGLVRTALESARESGVEIRREEKEEGDG